MTTPSLTVRSLARGRMGALAALALLGAALALALLAMPLQAQQAGNVATLAELQGLTYPNEFASGGSADLTDGAFSEDSVTVQFRQAAYGTLAGEPVAVVVLSTSAGASGTFYALHLIQSVDALLTAAAGVPLGDRIILQDLRVGNDQVRVDLTGHAQADPLCCPTQNMWRTYRLTDGALTLDRAQELPAALTVPEGLSPMGWYGGSTSSGAVLNSNGAILRLWWYDAATGEWSLDSRDLPGFVREPFSIERGTAMYVVASREWTIPQLLVTPPGACPTNPGPGNPLDPSIIVTAPGNGARFSGSVPVSGQARVFEATVSMRVLAADGTVLVEDFTTASTGAPDFGDFSADLAVDVTAETEACLQVFESSARDGEPTNVVQRAITLAPGE